VRRLPRRVVAEDDADRDGHSGLPQCPRNGDDDSCARGWEYLPLGAGAVMQEVIDVAAMVNALRMAFPPKTLTDY
jgi:hypothetical protein